MRQGRAESAAGYAGDRVELVVSDTREARQNAQVGQESREEELLRNAIQLFSRSGFRETSLQEIADELGITRPLFYYYFESKEDLLWRIIGHLGDTLLDQARPLAIAEGPPHERLRALFNKHIETLLNNVDAFRIYYAERHLLTGKRDLRLKRGEVHYHHLITDVITDGQRVGSSANPTPTSSPDSRSGQRTRSCAGIPAYGPYHPHDISTSTVDFILDGLTT